jgi:ATP-binding cassette subfamily B protein
VPEEDSSSAVDRELVEAAPAWVERTLSDFLEAGEERRALFCSDMTLEGEFGQVWLAITDRRLLVLSEDSDRPVQLHLPLRNITGVRARDYAGNGFLEVVTEDGAYSALRYSRAIAHKAGAASRLLEQLVEKASAEKGEKLPASGARGAVSFRAPEHRCPKCGRVLPKWSQEACPYCVPRGKLLLRIVGRMRPQVRLAILGFGLTIVLTALQLIPPYLPKILIDTAIPDHNLRLLWVVVGVLLAVHGASSLITAVRSFTMEFLGQRVMADLRAQLFDHLQILSLSFYNKRQTGQIMSRVTTDTFRLQYFLAEGLQELIVNLLTMVGIGAVLFSMDARLALLSLLPAPIVGVATYVFGRRIRRVYHRLWRRYASMHALLADTIPGVRVVKSFTQEARESRRFRRRSEDIVSGEIGAARLAQFFFPMMNLATATGYVIVWAYGGWVLITGAGGLTLGVMFAFTGYLWRFYMPIQSLGQLNHRLQHAATAAERVFEILDTTPDIQDKEGAETLPTIEGRVEFKDVSFTYDGMKMALQNVTFEANPGEMIGLVGPSGAGKSTLVHLLCRFYDVTEGAILMDGRDLRDVKLKSLREQIGVVLQDPFLFHGTIAQNIAYGKPNAKPDEIMAAARAANAHEFIMNFPDGYDTQAGERGVMLSAGERQRLAIARAVLRDPRILILDEATSSVDTETESVIQQAVERLVKNRTTFAIAHRLSTLRRADRLVVIENGKVAEAGTHDELLESGGIYSRLCRLQAELSRVRAW